MNLDFFLNLIVWIHGIHGIQLDSWYKPRLMVLTWAHSIELDHFKIQGGGQAAGHIETNCPNNPIKEVE